MDNLILMVINSLADQPAFLVYRQGDFAPTTVIITTRVMRIGMVWYINLDRTFSSGPAGLS